MGNQLRRAVEEMKKDYICKLLSEGVYSREERQLDEFTLSELEMEYRLLVQRKNDVVSLSRFERAVWCAKK